MINLIETISEVLYDHDPGEIMSPAEYEYRPEAEEIAERLVDKHWDMATQKVSISEEKMANLIYGVCCLWLTWKGIDTPSSIRWTNLARDMIEKIDRLYAKG